MIVKLGKAWILYTKHAPLRRLGVHKTYKAALAQERAIAVRKAQAGSKR